jgi:hypothetical protein
MWEMRGSNVVSDHFLVRTKVQFRISVESSKKMKCTKKIKKEILKRNHGKGYKKKNQKVLR